MGDSDDKPPPMTSGREDNGNFEDHTLPKKGSDWVV